MPPKFRRKLSKFFVRTKIPLLVLGMISLVSLMSLRSSAKPSFWWSVLFTNSLKQSDGLTNILLLGVTGGTHEGADLTDTMILASFNQQKSQVVLVSLPRDIWSENLKAKINSAYHYGEEKKPGGGFILAKTIIEEVTGLPVHYVAKIDLLGLKKLTDLLGGVEIEIERAFDDYKFPIEGKENDLCGGDPEYKCRYQHIYFDAGKQLLNGERVLQYIRSRQAEGEEGTDLSRNKRQQKFALALKEKIFSSQILLNPQELFSLSRILDEIIDTDFSSEELPYSWKMVIKANSAKIKTLNLEEFLVNPPVWQYGQWVLIPRTGDFGEIKEYLRQKIQD